MGHRNQYINQSLPATKALGNDVTTSICGTGAADVCVLRFDNIAQVGVGCVPTTVAAVGTIVTITRAGLYMCKLTYPTTAGGTINNIGITLNTDAAGRNNDPGMATTGIGDYASVLSPAVTNTYTKLSYLATITRAMAVAGAIIRFHAGDGLNATPNVLDLTEAECRFEVTLVGDLT